jgi:predicted lipoprotein with Yx(FWY)xxD motif
VSKSIYATTAVLAASLLLAACGSSSYSGGSSSAKSTEAPPTGAAAGTVRTASNPTAGGTILVDSSGMTLYRLSGESAAKFICTSQACMAVWHPLKAGSGATPTGASGLGTVKRPDGSEQVTYQGGPLYTFASDKAPGKATGRGIKDVGTWDVVVVGGSSGSSSGTAPANSKSSEGSPSSGGGGYAY